ncbi:MAG TPA: threonine aldolase, partial [Kribbella sp.]
MATYPTTTAPEDLRARRKAAAADCARWLTGRRIPAADVLRGLADAATESESDGYGSGGEV